MKNNAAIYILWKSFVFVSKIVSSGLSPIYVQPLTFIAQWNKFETQSTTSIKEILLLRQLVYSPSETFQHEVFDDKAMMF